MPRPNLDGFQFTDEETAAIRFALNQTDVSPWDEDKLQCSPEMKACISDLKNRIRQFHLAEQNHACCYCKTPTLGNVDFIVDREHILPKGKYREYTYEIWNLSASCKRCNMSYKKESTDFIEDEESIRTDLHNPNRYKFVHPNFDCWHTNLNRVVYENNGMKLIVIASWTTKGDYTKAFFNLSELEVDTFYTAQGGNLIDPVVAAIRASLPKQI